MRPNVQRTCLIGISSFKIGFCTRFAFYKLENLEKKIHNIFRCNFKSVEGGEKGGVELFLDYFI